MHAEPGIIKTMNFFAAILYFVVMSSLSALEALDVVADDQAALRRELFDPKRYDQFSSPYKNDKTENKSSAITFQLTLVVLHIHDLDEFTGTLTTNSWFLAHWIDYRLRWKPEDYGDVFAIQAPFNSVWLPELVLINDAEAMIMNTIADANIFIFRDGAVYWSAPVNLKTTCYIDHKFYPFDEHSCKISMRIWSMRTDHYTIDAIPIVKQHESELLTHFATDNPLWEITSRKTEIKKLLFECCPDEPFPVFETTLGLRRRSPLFKYILITPALISVLLTLALFWLPPTAQAKIGLGGVVVAIQIALLLFLGWRVPSGGQSIPSIVLFCGNTLVMSTLTVVTSVVVFRISKTSKATAVPDWIKFLTREPWKSVLCLGIAQSQVLVRFAAKVGFSNEEKEDAELIDSERVDADHQPKPAISTNPSDWLLIGTAIDRLCFIVYCFVIGIIFITSFS